MILSKVSYQRDLTKLHLTEVKSQDRTFLLRCIGRHLRQKYKEVHDVLICSESNFDRHLSQSKIKSVRTSDSVGSNTAVTIKLPSASIRGDVTFTYNRSSLPEYLGIVSLMDKFDNVKIDYNAFKSAYESSRQQLSEFIYNHITKHLGNKFILDGVTIITSHEHNKRVTMKGSSGMAVIIPSLTDINCGWGDLRNVTTYKNGSMLTQSLNVGIKVVADKHLFVQDGEAIINIKLERVLHNYEHNRVCEVKHVQN